MENQKTFLSSLRNQLKRNVYHNRIGWTYPSCPICHEAFSNREPSMHEVFIPRSVVRGCSFEVQQQIHVPQNVVLIHEPECHVYAQHYEEGKIQCALQIIEYEGYDTILEWMKHFDTLVKTTDNQKYTILESAYEIYKRKSGVHVESNN